MVEVYIISKRPQRVSEQSLPSLPRWSSEQNICRRVAYESCWRVIEITLGFRLGQVGCVRDEGGEQVTYSTSIGKDGDRGERSQISRRAVGREAPVWLMAFLYPDPKRSRVVSVSEQEGPQESRR